MELLPLPPDSELLAAREDIPVREAELNVARARAERAAQLLQGRSGSQEQLEQAQAELVRAEAALRLATLAASVAARRRRERVDADHIGEPRAGRAGRAACGVGTARLGRCTALHRRRSRPALGARAGVLVGSNCDRPGNSCHGCAARHERRPSPRRAAQPVAGPPTANPNAASDRSFLRDRQRRSRLPSGATRAGRRRLAGKRRALGRAVVGDSARHPRRLVGLRADVAARLRAHARGASAGRRRSLRCSREGPRLAPRS